MVLGVSSHGVRCCCHGTMVGALVVAVGTVVVAGEVVSMAPTVVIIIKQLDVVTALLAAAVATVPTVSFAFDVATTITTVDYARFILPSPIVVVIIATPIVPPIVLLRIVNLLLHH